MISQIDNLNLWRVLFLVDDKLQWVWIRARTKSEARRRLKDKLNRKRLPKELEFIMDNDATNEIHSTGYKK